MTKHYAGVFILLVQFYWQIKSRVQRHAQTMDTTYEKTYKPSEAILYGNRILFQQ